MIHQDVWCFFLGTVFWYPVIYIYMGLYHVVPTVPSRWDHRVRRRNNENPRFCAKRNNDWKWPWCSFFCEKNGRTSPSKISEMDANGSKWINLRPKIEAFEDHAHPWIIESNSDTCFGSLLNLVFYSADIWFGGGVVMQRIWNKINKGGRTVLFVWVSNLHSTGFTIPEEYTRRKQPLSLLTVWVWNSGTPQNACYELWWENYGHILSHAILGYSISRPFETTKVSRCTSVRYDGWCQDVTQMHAYVASRTEPYGWTYLISEACAKGWLCHHISNTRCTRTGRPKWRAVLWSHRSSAATGSCNEIYRYAWSFLCFKLQTTGILGYPILPLPIFYVNFRVEPSHGLKGWEVLCKNCKKIPSDLLQLWKTIMFIQYPKSIYKCIYNI